MQAKTRFIDAAPIGRVAPLLLMALLVSGQAVAKNADPDAARVVEKVQQKYEDSIRDVENMEVVTGKNVIRYRKVEDDGHSYLEYSGQEIRPDNEMNVMTGESGHTLLTPSVFADLKQNARHEGKDVFREHPVHVLYVDELVMPNRKGEPAVTMQEARFHVDSDDWVLRKVSFTTEIELEDGRKQAVDPVTTFEDYRNVGGMLIAFRTVTRVTGISGTLTEKQRREAKAAMRELEALPPAQKKMAEQVMGDKISKYRKVLDEDQMQMMREIEAVRVNTDG